MVMVVEEDAIERKIREGVRKGRLKRACFVGRS